MDRTAQQENSDDRNIRRAFHELTWTFSHQD
jgi:hypothetical protein